MKFKKLVMMLLLFSVLTICTFYNNITKAEGETEEKIYCDATIDDEFTDNEILIVLTNEESLKFSEYTVNSFSEINCIAIDDLTDGYKDKIEQQLNGTYTGNMPVNLSTFNRIFKLTLGINSKQYVLNSIKELEKRSDILSASPNVFLGKADLSVNMSASSLDLEEFEYIDLTNVWNITTGSPSVKVGVIDSGISDVHTDLVDNLDCSLSRSMSDIISSNPALNQSSDRIFANPFYDCMMHGTSVAGVIGADGDNDQYLRGVCWDVSLVSLKAFDNSKYASNINKVINAFTYATYEEIPILNCSFGWYNKNSLTDEQIIETFDLFLLNNDPSQYRSQYMITTSTAATIKQAIENYPGIVICAAGNENFGIDVQTNYNGYENDSSENIYFYPASLDCGNIIVVGSATKLAENEGWERSYFSNYGNAVDIYAPGSNIVVLKVDMNDNIGMGREDGTSFSAPYVAGVAALILSNSPLMSMNELKSCILNSATIINNFGTNDYNISFSGNVINPFGAVTYHNHNYSYLYWDYLQHTCECPCGNETLEDHTWSYSGIGVNDIDPAAVIGPLICSKCGATKVANSSTGEVMVLPPEMEKEDVYEIY